jgi:WhiB family redox-sensing transcriptional regulator
LTEQHWSVRAKCLGKWALFHSYKSEDIAEAKSICAACPVRLQCLQEALDTGERFGIRGGVIETELRIVQGINSKGETFVNPTRKIRCLFCGPRSTPNLDVVEHKRTKTLIHCTVCGLKWVTRKIINRKKTNF